MEQELWQDIEHRKQMNSSNNSIVYLNKKIDELEVEIKRLTKLLTQVNHDETATFV